jgi:hypothetical protein
MKYLILILALAGSAQAQIPSDIDNSCFGVAVASHPATAMNPGAVYTKGDGTYSYRATKPVAWVDVQNSTNTASIYCAYNTPSSSVSVTSATIAAAPTISTFTAAGISTSGWSISAGATKLFPIVPGRVLFCRNNSEATTTGATVCVGR